MYHPALIEQAQRQLETVYREALPNGLLRYPVAVCTQMAQRLAGAISATGEPTRRLTPEEETFIGNERLLCKIDFRYMGERYIKIRGANGLQSLYPLWEPQEIILGKLAALQLQRQEEGHPDGILFNVLKARQEGVSTLCQALCAHRVVTATHVNAMTASDVPENSGSEGQFGKFELIVEHLPWYLRPATKFHKKDTHWAFANSSWMTVESGKSMKGGLQEQGGAKGNLGRSKSQPLDAGVLTPTGWRRMGELAVGDLVIGKNGQPTPITGVFPQGEQPTWRITCSDGSSTECSTDHLWEVRVRNRWDDVPLTKVLSVDLLLAEGLRGHKGIWRYQLPLVEPVLFFGDLLPIDPYLLGLLIGDGCLSHGRAGFTSADPAIAARVRGTLPDGHKLTLAKSQARAQTHFIVADVKGKPNRVVRALWHLGLAKQKSATKFIPRTYRQAAPNDRLRLLQGLMDADGWIAQDGRLGYCTVSKELATHVVELVQGLGGTATVGTTNPTYTYKGEKRLGQLAYRIALKLPPDLEPFWLARKRDKYAALDGRRVPPARKVVAIDYVGMKPSQCIRVGAPDHLYVTDGYIVTHNTFTVLHTTEISTWEHPEQIDDGLLPAVPRSPRTLWGKESTAKGRHNWHHEDWLEAVRGHGHGAVGGRFIPIFLPWYALANNWLPSPLDWVPDPQTLAHAQKAEREGPKWLGRPVRLTRTQLYWYEQTRMDYVRKNALAKFLEEQAADPEECFQHSGKSIFGHEQLAYLARLAKPMIDCWGVNMAKDLQEIRSHDLEQIRLTKQLAATIEDTPHHETVELDR